MNIRHLLKNNINDHFEDQDGRSLDGGLHVWVCVCMKDKQTTK